MSRIDLRWDAKPLKDALKEIQKVTHSSSNELEPIVTKANYQCCQSCGCSFIAHDHGNDCNYIFYHEQGNEDLKNWGEVNLYHNIPANQRRFVVDTLRKHGNKVDWNGDQDRSIRVAIPKHYEVVNQEHHLIETYIEEVA